MVTPAPTGALRRSPATGLESDVRTLADEHALLLRGVHRRGASVLALAAARTWPYAELGTLTEFPRTAVLPQACDEEELLYPNVSAPFAELGAAHAHLRALTEGPPRKSHVRGAGRARRTVRRPRRRAMRDRPHRRRAAALTRRTSVNPHRCAACGAHCAGARPTDEFGGSVSARRSTRAPTAACGGRLGGVRASNRRAMGSPTCRDRSYAAGTARHSPPRYLSGEPSNRHLIAN